MSNGSQRSQGRYTTFFTSIAAEDVNVPGLTPGSAGARGAPLLPGASQALSTYPAAFTVGPDVAALVQYTRRFVPARPANLQEDRLPKLLAAD
jgi:hypothetical protein